MGVFLAPAVADVDGGWGVVTLLNDGKAGFTPVPFRFEDWSPGDSANVCMPVQR